MGAKKMLGIFMVEKKKRGPNNSIKLICICTTLLFTYIMEIFVLVSRMENRTVNCLLR